MLQVRRAPSSTVEAQEVVYSVNTAETNVGARVGDSASNFKLLSVAARPIRGGQWWTIGDSAGFVAIVAQDHPQWSSSPSCHAVSRPCGSWRRVAEKVLQHQNKSSDATASRSLSEAVIDVPLSSKFATHATHARRIPSLDVLSPPFSHLLADACSSQPCRYSPAAARITTISERTSCCPSTTDSKYQSYG